MGSTFGGYYLRKLDSGQVEDPVLAAFETFFENFQARDPEILKQAAMHDGRKGYSCWDSIYSTWGAKMKCVYEKICPPEAVLDDGPSEYILYTKTGGWGYLNHTNQTTFTHADAVARFQWYIYSLDGRARGENPVRAGMAGGSCRALCKVRNSSIRSAELRTSATSTH